MKAIATLLAAGAAASVYAQSLDIIVQEGPAGSFTMYATLNNPTGTIRAVISDLAFTMTAVNVSNFSYNPAFDSAFFGPAMVSVTSTTVEFSGANTVPPLNNPGGPDASNPLQIATFNANGITGFTVNGQLTGAYVGSPFDDVFFYQNANGTPGTVPFSVNLPWPPAPGTASLLALAGIGATRRNRSHNTSPFASQEA